MEATQNRTRAALISVLASLFIFGLKAWAYYVTHSAAVFSDALESIVNVVASIVALVVIRFVAQPADSDHPYGHGKAEYFSAAFEGGMIFFAALMIGYESIKAFSSPDGLHKLEFGLLIVGGAAIINLFLGLYLRKVGRKHHSKALQASAAHILADVWTTVGILLGLGIVLLTKIPWLDPLLALLVAIQLGYSGIQIIRDSMGGLIDAADEKVIGDLASAFNRNRVPGIIDIHHLRAIRSGSFHHVDAHLVVPEFWDVSLAHQVTNEFENKVVENYPTDGEIAFHLDPCKRQFCSICDVFDCPIRRSEFKQRREFNLQNLTAGPNPDDGTKTSPHY